ncbi:hypothetical protein O1W71_11915 [Microbacterium sp. H37-C3]|uniref:hypothetical protein n=1 Tax=Microbacterium sp. H37-C3 TaxID=3004354 RepID=UPI0022AF510C|nr:hypothetical protein [Microbacterium sp. H37-C3]MCZ4068376.1 hypothetical protein [Microbacterium sp. H37-C3]
MLDEKTTVRIFLNDVGSPPGTFVALHPHYQDWAPYRIDVSPEKRNDILLFGAIRPYKRTEEFIELAASDPSHLYALVGAPNTSLYAAHLKRLAAPIGNLRTELGYLSDEELAAWIQASELVVLPYRSFYNSGAALLALSLARPVLVPQNEFTRALQNEIGEGWVNITEDFTKSAVDSALAAPRPRKPDLSKRSVEAHAKTNIAAYLAATAGA